MQRINDLYSAWHGKDGGRIQVFPTAALAETTSPDLLKAVRAFAEKYDLGYTIHLSQSVAEVDFMVKYYGLRPPAFLAKHDFLGPRLFAAHCRYVDEADMALLGNSRTIISHQAAMAANRGVIPPIPQLRAAGCPIAYGTDNNTNDMFEVMRVALLTERIKRDDPLPGIRPQPEDMLEDATLGGARAIRREKITGALEVGRRADLIVLETRRAHLVPAGRILSAWIPQRTAVGHRKRDGGWQVRDAQPQGHDFGRSGIGRRSGQGGTAHLVASERSGADRDSRTRVNRRMFDQRVASVPAGTTQLLLSRVVVIRQRSNGERDEACCTCRCRGYCCGRSACVRGADL